MIFYSQTAKDKQVAIKCQNSISVKLTPWCFVFNFILLSQILSFLTEKSTAVQLRGPTSRNGTGRVEIYYNGIWGTICDDGWDMNDAEVACRDLGYKYTISHRRRNNVPYGTGQIWLHGVACTGNEQRLSDCSHGGWGNSSYCWHYEDAGVECSSAGTLHCQYYY